MKFGRGQVYASVLSTWGCLVRSDENHVEFKPEATRRELRLNVEPERKKVYVDRCIPYARTVSEFSRGIGLESLVDDAAFSGVSSCLVFANVGISSKESHVVGVMRKVCDYLLKLQGSNDISWQYGCYGLTDAQCIDWVLGSEVNVFNLRTLFLHSNSEGIFDIFKISSLGKLPSVLMLRIMNMRANTVANFVIADLISPFCDRSSRLHNSKLHVGVFNSFLELHKIIDNFSSHGVNTEVNIENPLTFLLRDFLVNRTRMVLSLSINPGSDPKKVSNALEFAKSWMSLSSVEVETRIDPEVSSLRKKVESLKERISANTTKPKDSCDKAQVKKFTSLLEMSRLRSKKLITTLIINHIELEEADRLNVVSRINTEYQNTLLRWKISMLNIKMHMMTRVFGANSRALSTKLASVSKKKSALERRLIKITLLNRSNKERMMLKYRSERRPGFLKRYRDNDPQYIQISYAKAKLEAKKRDVAELERCLMSYKKNYHTPEGRLPSKIPE